ncbi:hypothetical protein Aperf_G00000125545 [Anoplocephala perfoliata]
MTFTSFHPISDPIGYSLISAKFYYSQDTIALIERLKTGNEPPSDVPIVHLDVDDPPPAPSSQIRGRQIAGGDSHTDASSRLRLSSISIENIDSGIYYASIPVSPAAGRGSSPFAGADPVVEPYEAHRLHTAPTITHPASSRSARRSSLSSMGLGSNGSIGGHSSFLWKVFARRNKRIGSGDEGTVPFEVTKPWRNTYRSNSVGSYPSLENDALPWKSSTMEKKFSAKYKTHRSREPEKWPEGGVHNSRNSKSQLQRESPKKIEIAHVGHEGAGESVAASPSDISDADARSNLSGPTVIARNASPLKTSKSVQEVAQMTTELSRSLPSPSSSSNDIHGSKTKLNRSPPVSHIESRPSERYHTGTNKNSSASSPQIQRDVMARTVPTSNTTRQNTQEITSPRKKIYHQPRRQHANHYQIKKAQAESRVSHRSPSMSDLIAVGKCKALYDFESSQYGDTFISFKQGDELRVISSSARWQGNPDTDGWIYAETIPPSNDLKCLPQRGFIPAAFVEINLFPEPIPLSLPRKREVDEGINHKGSHNNLRNNNSFLALGQATEL